MSADADVLPDACGCSGSDEKGALITVDAALNMLTATALPVGSTEIVGLPQSYGRVLAGPVYASIMAPQFDNAAMDGYAINSSVLVGDPPWTLSIVDRIAAGCAAQRPLQPFEAAQVFTGAPIPLGANAVVMQETVRRLGLEICLDRRPAAGLNVRMAGGDMLAGQKVLEEGRRLGAPEIAVAAAAGHECLAVRRCPRVALLVTGSELRHVGDWGSACRIPDINSPMLTALLSSRGVELVGIGQAGDDRREVAQRLIELSAGADLIVTTGGLSVGEEDHVKPALVDLGAEILFSGVAMKPGKPVSFGRLGATLWLGLPGNPLAAFVTWQALGIHLLRCLGGEAGAAMPRRYVVSASSIHWKTGRCEFRPARISGLDPRGQEIAIPEDITTSGGVGTLSGADGFLILSDEAGHLVAGSTVAFQPFLDA